MRRLAITTMVLAGSTVPAAFAQESYTAWDNFNGDVVIKASRWLALERVRKVEGSVLRMIQRDLGSQSSDAGIFTNTWSTNFSNPGPITQIRASVIVDAFEVTGCAGNPEPSVVQARLLGEFFNAGPGLPTSRLNDVGATIRLQRLSNSADAANVLRVDGTVYKCTNADCTTVTGMGSVDLGTINTTETASLRMEWEPDRDRFNFYRGTNPVQRVTYDVDDSMAPFQLIRQIATRTQLANCFSGGRSAGFVNATFNNVAVNASAAP